jgi:hypothetical protein
VNLVWYFLRFLKYFLAIKNNEYFEKYLFRVKVKLNAYSVLHGAKMAKIKRKAKKLTFGNLF